MDSAQDSESAYFLEEGKTFKSKPPLNILDPEAKLKRKIPILSDVKVHIF